MQAEPFLVTPENATEIALKLRREFNETRGNIPGSGKTFEEIYYGDQDENSALCHHPALAGTFNIQAHQPLMVYFLTQALCKDQSLINSAWSTFQKIAPTPRNPGENELEPDFDEIHLAISQRLQQEKLGCHKPLSGLTYSNVA